MGTRKSISYYNALHLDDESKWGIVANGIDYGEAKEIDGWDYQTDLEIQSTFPAGFSAAIREACQLPEESEINAFLKWESGSGIILTQGFSSPERIRDDGFTISASPDSGDIANKLTLRVTVALDKAVPAKDPLVPQKKGMILWQSDPFVCELEGAMSDFPVAEVDFRKDEHLESSALWALHWIKPTDYETQASGAVRILLNKEHKEIEALRKIFKQENLMDHPLIAVLFWDIRSQLLQKALYDGDYEVDNEFPEGSIGQVIKFNWKTVFDDQQVREIREAHNHSPRKFYSRLQNGTTFVKALGGVEK
tara:strand:- start:658 stop:1581 length:924 start_codon:yes stop_codon:yes gene_type:complete